VIFGFPYQTVRLVHESISRGAFGRGALFGAKWLVDQPTGFYTMEEVVRQKFASHILDELPNISPVRIG
jgi:4-hydroxy-tetrahydrodipicolinate reductase